MNNKKINYFKFFYLFSLPIAIITLPIITLVACDKGDGILSANWTNKNKNTIDFKFNKVIPNDFKSKTTIILVVKDSFKRISLAYKCDWNFDENQKRFTIINSDAIKIINNNEITKELSIRYSWQILVDVKNLPNPLTPTGVLIESAHINVFGNKIFLVLNNKFFADFISSTKIILNSQEISTSGWSLKDNIISFLPDIKILKKDTLTIEYRNEGVILIDTSYII